MKNCQQDFFVTCWSLSKFVCLYKPFYKIKVPLRKQRHKNQKSRSSQVLKRSFACIFKTRDPGIDTWGKSLSTSTNCAKIPLTDVLSRWFTKQLLNYHLQSLGLHIVVIYVSLLNKSKALLESSKTQIWLFVWLEREFFTTTDFVRNSAMLLPFIQNGFVWKTVCFTSFFVKNWIREDQNWRILL